MFGRFGGGGFGGTFVAQYRIYPVSFIDRVRLPPPPRGRHFRARRLNAATEPADPLARRDADESPRLPSRPPPSAFAPVSSSPQPQLENGDKGARPRGAPAFSPRDPRLPRASVVALA